MRAALLPLLLSGCSLLNGYDGTYLMTFRVEDDSCSPGSVGNEAQSLGSMYRTGSHLVLDIDGSLLVGDPVSDGSFEVGLEAGSEFSYDGCDSYSTFSGLTVEGTFGQDLGFDGDATSVSRTSTEGCPGESTDTCTRKYSVTALKLDATTDRRPTGSIAWGYFGGSGGY